MSEKLNSIRKIERQYFIRLVDSDRIVMTPFGRELFSCPFAQIGIDISSIKTGEEFTKACLAVSRNNPYWPLELKVKQVFKKMKSKTLKRFTSIKEPA